MASIFDRDKQIKAYLLNQLSESEIAVLEDELLRNQMLAERLEVLEMILIDSYVRNEMSSEEARVFDVEFVAIPGNLSKVEDARIFHGTLNATRGEAPDTESAAQNRLITWLTELFSAKPLQAAAVALAGILLFVALVFTAILINKRQRTPDQIVREEPTPSNPDKPIPENRNPKNPEFPTQKATPPPHDVYAKRLPKPHAFQKTQEEWLSIAGQGPSVLGQGVVHFKLKKDRKILRLFFELTGDLAKRPTLEIVLTSGREVIQPTPTTVEPRAVTYLDKPRVAISVDVPVDKLKSGVPYRLEIANTNQYQDFTIKK